MSRISEISRQYQRALESSHSRFEVLYGERRDATEDYCAKFLNRLICPFGDRFRNERVRERLQEAIERFTGTRDLSFIAIDGTCQRQPMSECITFFGGAYGAKVQVKLLGGTRKKALPAGDLEPLVRAFWNVIFYLDKINKLAKAIA
jgi:hypothetical protein